MRVVTAIQTSMTFVTQDPALPADFLNCYEIQNVGSLVWPVNLYSVRRSDRTKARHEDRSVLKDLFFELRRKHSSRCKGYGFICDTDAESVVIPAEWKIPDLTDYNGYDVNFSHTFLVKGSDPYHQQIIVAIIREGLKKHFKENLRSRELGYLWQDFGSFCQMPTETTENGYSLCRRFNTSVRYLRGGKLVVACAVSTAMIDGRSLADYYKVGEVDLLAEMIESKRSNRITRRNKPPGIRVWHDMSTEYTTAADVLELDDPDVILAHGHLSATQQHGLRTQEISCKYFGRPSISVPLSDLRLILDANILGEGHSDTIIQPDDRERFMSAARNFLDGANIYGKSLTLSKLPFDVSRLPTYLVSPPSTRVKAAGKSEKVIKAPRLDSEPEKNLTLRARERSNTIRRNGFLQRRTINPVLAFPTKFGEPAGLQMKKLLDEIWEEQGVGYRFGHFQFSNVDELRRAIEHHGYDCVIAVLPERSSHGNRPDDTHERIKKGIEVPSQCIHIDHTTPREWVGKSFREFQNQKPRWAARIRQTYELCLLNLLVKHGWVPFAPFDPFHYNVQVGIDVGGRHNNRVMTCLGYGFSRPQDGLLFRPEEIPIDLQKAEPIPTEYLYRGLLNLFEFMHDELSSVGITPDFERVLFLRDGSLLGDGDEWNEREALIKLHSELLRRKWLSERSVWPAAELSKRAEDLRLFRNNAGVVNPLAGRCVFPFDDDNEALLCTTGAPYLTQGTASPIRLTMSKIFGNYKQSEVVQDIVWGADMAFTKPDTGLKLPWVLHVADTGALQLSRSYKVSGITV